MSTTPSHDDSVPQEPFADVFARLADVPLELVDKLVESTRAVYTDLNKIRAHPYWADLVFQQGAAVRALNEASEALNAFRAEAIGAGNTERGIIVATAVVDGDRRYAHGPEEKNDLVESLLRPRTPGRACHLFAWDRPHDNELFPGPYQQIRVVTDTETGLGVLNYTEETEDGELHSWHTCGPRPPAEAPVLRFDVGSALTFPRSAVLEFASLRKALAEFAASGLRPQCVDWQQARWGE